jgi:hypothetical protein
LVQKIKEIKEQGAAVGLADPGLAAAVATAAAAETAADMGQQQTLYCEATGNDATAYIHQARAGSRIINSYRICSRFDQLESLI